MANHKLILALQINLAIVLFGGPIVHSEAVAADRKVRGRVLDAGGKSIGGIDVSAGWRANGPPHDKDGKPYDFSQIDAQKAYWGNVGLMFPHSEAAVRTAADGQFTIMMPENRHQLMAMDSDRKTGAFVILADDEDNIEIQLAPLVRVKGAVEGPEPGTRPEWSHVWLLVPEDPTRPLNFPRLAGCGSFDARFEFALPPGRYLIDPAWVTDDDERLQMVPTREITVTGESAEIDLGTLLVTRSGPTLSTRIQQSKAEGRWSDYTDHYGEKPPSWNVVDAKGVKKDVTLSDFQGKWVLVDFWGLSCIPCLRTGMPKLVKFYEEHKSHRDQFEILAICIDPDGELKSIEDLDKKLEPIIEHVWKKPLPFPVLLDPTFKTWERYGLPGLGTVILIDPEGRLIEGDETTLATILAKP